MKKIILVIAGFIFAANVMAQDNNYGTQSEKPKNTSYCAMLKDGKMMLMAEGKQVFNDVRLANGTEIKTDGTVIKADKSEAVLKNGDCIDQDGHIIPFDKKAMQENKEGKENEKTDLK
jgi:hypothetical protein